VADLLLVGASGLAREVLAVVRATGSHRVLGYLDDDRARHGLSLRGVPILGGIDAVADHPGAEVLICVGKGSAREALARRIEERAPGVRYATAVHPSVDVPAGCSIGAGSVVLAHVAITADVSVGRHVVVMPNVTLTHDDVVDDFATIAAGAHLGGGVVIGSRAYVGMGVGVRERTRIGTDVVVGMGAVVLHDVPDGETWVGVPARVLAATG
jgi:sugar O-acyltransferase (sialic acid O-acetyltransferase NeuD family)